MGTHPASHPMSDNRSDGRAGGTTERGTGVIAFAALGYAYVAGLIAVLVFGGLGLVMAGAGQLMWLPAGLLLLVLNALWVRIPPPEGRVVKRSEAPALFRLVDDVCVALDAPAAHVVLITADVNAAVVDLPRFVFFGSRRYLMLGLPLLAALPEREVRAVLAHEFAHLAHHGRLLLWARRLQMTWTALAFAVQWSRNWAAILFVPFFRWYAPRFSVAVEAASRVDECESDRLAGDHAGVDAVAAGLARIELCTAFVERVVLPRIVQESAWRDTPPSDAVRRIVEAVPDAVAHDTAVTRAATLLARRTLDADSHPGLADRLAALGVPQSPGEAADLVARLRDHSEPPSAAALLGGDHAVRQLAEELGHSWTAAVRAEWQRLRADAEIWQAGRSERLSGAADDRGVEWARARWAADCEPSEVAIPLLRRVLERDPDRTEARLQWGRLQLDLADGSGRTEGQRQLERVMGEDSGLALEAAELLERHYARQGRADEQRRCRLRLEQLRADFLRSLRERGALHVSDTLRSYPLPSVAAARFRERFASHPEIRQAFVVQKRTKYLAATPVVMVAVHVAVPWYKPSLGNTAARVCEALVGELVLPETVDLVVVAVEPRTRMLRRLRRLAGAEIYRADRDQAAPRAAPSAAWDTPSRLSVLLSVRSIGIAALVVSAVLVVFVTWQGGSYGGERPARSADELVEAVRRDPEDALANRELMWALIDQKRLDEAMAIAPTAVRLNPDDPYAHNSLGWLHVQRHEFAAALPSLETAIRLAPNHEYAHRNLGFALANLGRFEEAEVAYRKALRVTPDNPDAVSEHSLVLADLRRFDEAERRLRAGIARAPGAARLHFTLGYILKNQGSLQPALDAFREAARLAPSNPDPWLQIGVIEHVDENYPAAVAALRKAGELDSAYFQRRTFERAVLEASLEGRPYTPQGSIRE